MARGRAAHFRFAPRAGSAQPVRKRPGRAPARGVGGAAGLCPAGLSEL